MCHYLVQNIIFLLIPFLWWYFDMRNEPGFLNTKSYNYAEFWQTYKFKDFIKTTIASESNKAGWTGIFLLILIDIFYIIDQIPIFSWLLNWAGIQTCGF